MPPHFTDGKYETVKSIIKNFTSTHTVYPLQRQSVCLLPILEWKFLRDSPIHKVGVLEGSTLSSDYTQRNQDSNSGSKTVCDLSNLNLIFLICKAGMPEIIS